MVVILQLETDKLESLTGLGLPPVSQTNAGQIGPDLVPKLGDEANRLTGG